MTTATDADSSTARPRGPARLAARARFGLLLGLALAPVLWVTTSGPALAHAYVLATTPANGDQLDELPGLISVTFSEPVTLPEHPDNVSVIDSGGERVDLGTSELSADRTVLTFEIAPDLPPDRYIASWSVISADSHPVGGSIQFGYLVPASAIASESTGGPTAELTLVTGAVKGLLYAALVVGLGLTPALRVLRVAGRDRRHAVRAARIALGVAGALSGAQVVVQYLWISSALPGEPPDVEAFLTSDYSVAVAARVILLAAAAAVMPTVPSRARDDTSAVLGLGVVGTLVRNGHGGSGTWWEFASTFLHATGAIAWVGGLVALGWLLLQRRLDGDRLRALPRWSLYASTAVVLLVVSGLVQALVRVRFVPALFSTTYGWALMAKLALVAVAACAALLAHRWTRANVADPDVDGGPRPGQTARLRSRVRLEAGVGLAVVLLSGVLSSITPAEAAYAPQEMITTEVGPYTAAIQVGPLRRGPQTFRITVTPPTADAPLPQELRLVLSQADGPAELSVDFPYRLPQTIQAGEPTPFVFVSAAVEIPASDVWIGTLTVVAAPLEQYTTAFDYRVL